ncbi:MAG: sialate O-acetylesterase [Verrucomicrobiae bacterium]|nr:sialate O-acetylesterase [Verrucomicrobiae bacterium]
MIQRYPVRFMAGLIAGLAIARASVALELPAVFSDNMVLQQELPLTVWGWADDGERVTVKFRGQSVSTVARNLKWSVTLKPLRAGGPDILTVASRTRTLTFTNVLVGEVWLCSGQSNMQWPMQRAFNPAADIATATNPLLRLFQVPRAKATAPVVRLNAAWQISSPEAVQNFSAVAYYFGRDLHAARRVPIGLIESDWGGSPVEVWMSREALEINEQHWREVLLNGERNWKRYEETLTEHRLEKALAERAGQKFDKPEPRAPWRPTELYNGMIAPLIPFALRGAIWYQGEANAGRAEQYRRLFPDLIRNWRRDWGHDFTFLAVQLAPWDKNRKRSLEEITAQPEESDWAELREAQLLATKLLPNVGLAVITDVGDKDDIHPTRKQPVGARLALAARALAYRERITWSGPIYRDMKIVGDKIILRFDHVGKGLEARDGPLTGFAICGEDRKFVWANAEILPDNTVAVSSPQVPKPVAVRYGWADFPVVNLWNKDGLPASPFRTDDFPLTTAGKY